MWAYYGPLDLQRSSIFKALRPEICLTSPASLSTILCLPSVPISQRSLLTMGVDRTSIEYQKAHAYENRATEIIIPHVVCLVFAVVAVALRFVSRRLKAGIHLDDWMCLLALVQHFIS